MGQKRERGRVDDLPRTRPVYPNNRTRFRLAARGRPWAMSGREHSTKRYTTSLAAGFQGRSIDALLRICDRLTFTAGLSTGIVSYNRDGLVRRRMRFSRR